MAPKSKEESFRLPFVVTAWAPRIVQAVLGNGHQLNSSLPMGMGVDKILQKTAEGEVALVVLPSNPPMTCVRKCYRKSNLNNLQKHHVLRECSLQSKIHHPNIVDLYACWETETEYVLLQEYMDSGDLFQEVHQKPVTTRGDMLREKRTARFIEPLLAALEYLHNARMVHRDVKLENVFVSKQGRTKLGDFGFIINTETERPTTRLGTLVCMGPEVLKVGMRLGSRSETVFEADYGTEVDIWALGCMFYELLMCQSPFTGNTFEEVLASTERKVSLAPGYSPEAQDFLARCLEKNQTKRASAVELLEHPWLRMTLGRSPGAPVNTAVARQLGAMPNVSRASSMRIQPSAVNAAALGLTPSPTPPSPTPQAALPAAPYTPQPRPPSSAVRSQFNPTMSVVKKLAAHNSLKNMNPHVYASPSPTPPPMMNASRLSPGDANSTMLKSKPIMARSPVPSDSESREKKGGLVKAFTNLFKSKDSKVDLQESSRTGSTTANPVPQGFGSFEVVHTQGSGDQSYHMYGQPHKYVDPLNGLHLRSADDAALQLAALQQMQQQDAFEFAQQQGSKHNSPVRINQKQLYQKHIQATIAPGSTSSPLTGSANPSGPPVMSTAQKKMALMSMSSRQLLRNIPDDDEDEDEDETSMRQSASEPVTMGASKPAANVQPPVHAREAALKAPVRRTTSAMTIDLTRVNESLGITATPVGAAAPPTTSARTSELLRASQGVPLYRVVREPQGSDLYSNNNAATSRTTSRFQSSANTLAASANGSAGNEGPTRMGSQKKLNVLPRT